MGHVDHGKTTLLDTLRSASVAQSEAGGITQHIGAFEVPLNKLFTAASARPRTSQTITFLDTPGHAAFKAMRARGAGVTDVAVLVVAADDGVKPQTREVIELLKGTDVAIVVAVTKCDKPGVKTVRSSRLRCKSLWLIYAQDIVEGELADAGITVESLGGDVPCVHVSAFTKQGMDDLVETITAIADVRDLRAERTGVRSEGRVIEAHVKNGKGCVGFLSLVRSMMRTNNRTATSLRSSSLEVRSRRDRSSLPAKPTARFDVSSRLLALCYAKLILVNLLKSTAGRRYRMPAIVRSKRGTRPRPSRPRRRDERGQNGFESWPKWPR